MLLGVACGLEGAVPREVAGTALGAAFVIVGEGPELTAAIATLMPRWHRPTKTELGFQLHHPAAPAARWNASVTPPNSGSPFALAAIGLVVVETLLGNRFSRSK